MLFLCLQISIMPSNSSVNMDKQGYLCVCVCLKAVAAREIYLGFILLRPGK